jgi:hypothetical protein
MITSAQAAQYLDGALGIVLPGFIVDAAVGKVATAEAAMVTAGYDVFTQTLVQSMAVTIVAAAGDPRRLQSQSAPSGAGRSFKNAEKALSALRRSLAALDTAGTVTDIVGPDPAAGSLFMVVCG